MNVRPGIYKYRYSNSNGHLCKGSISPAKHRSKPNCNFKQFYRRKVSYNLLNFTCINFLSQFCWAKELEKENTFASVGW